MRINLNVSEKNESTRSPYWLIVDPRDVSGVPPAERHCFVLGMIDGPFCSREAAQTALDARRYAYSEHAQVWCACAHRNTQWAQQVQY